MRNYQVWCATTVSLCGVSCATNLTTHARIHNLLYKQDSAHLPISVFSQQARDWLTLRLTGCCCWRWKLSLTVDLVDGAHSILYHYIST